MVDPRANLILPQPDRKYIRGEVWRRKCREHGMFCHYCDTPLTFDTVVKEHLTPVCRGGSSNIENIVPSCVDCNLMKAWRTEEEFLRDRPQLLAKRTMRRAIGKPKPEMISMEEANEPGLLKRLLDERDRGTSWFWRNPA
jgi:hypothetical protein